jgi:lipid A 3-O-deacylase
MLLASCGALVAPANDARAEDAHRFGLLEENDSLYADSDKHYTQGLRLSDLSPAIGAHSAWNRPFDMVADIAPVFSRGGPASVSSRRGALFLGQSIFTPENKTLREPDPSDRPYAAWLYVGAGLLQETDRRMLENLELTLGIVGPGALGRQVQNNFHQFIGISQARGWSHDIQTEPGVMLSYERLWRQPLIGDGDNGLDIVPQLGATVGNVMTYGAAGAMVRIGKNLRADYGPARIRPALSGTDYFDGGHLDGKLGFYLFAGFQGRIVGQNIFLDGNSFRQSPSVDKKAFVGDLQVGASLFWSDDLRLNFSVMRRSREFDGQPAPDMVGTASLAFTW